MRTFSHVLLRAYTALRLSAGAVMLDLPFDGPEDQPPIVRSSMSDGPAGFDRREIIVRSGTISVVTLPVARRDRQPPAYLLN